jgi:hypothetical protein
MYNTPAPQDSDGAYLLDWAAGPHCISLSGIPATPPDHCREYTFTFTWVPDDLFVSQSASSGTSSHGCHTFPSRTGPGVCFMSPAPNSVNAMQSITIVGRERMPNGEERDVFRTEPAIRFRDRPQD